MKPQATASLPESLGAASRRTALARKPTMASVLAAANAALPPTPAPAALPSRRVSVVAATAAGGGGGGGDGKAGPSRPTARRASTVAAEPGHVPVSGSVAGALPVRRPSISIPRMPDEQPRRQLHGDAWVRPMSLVGRVALTLHGAVFGTFVNAFVSAISCKSITMSTAEYLAAGGSGAALAGDAAALGAEFLRACFAAPATAQCLAARTEEVLMSDAAVRVLSADGQTFCGEGAQAAFAPTAMLALAVFGLLLPVGELAAGLWHGISLLPPPPPPTLPAAVARLDSLLPDPATAAPTKGGPPASAPPAIAPLYMPVLQKRFRPSRAWMHAVNSALLLLTAGVVVGLGDAASPRAAVLQAALLAGAVAVVLALIAWFRPHLPWEGHNAALDVWVLMLAIVQATVRCTSTVALMTAEPAGDSHLARFGVAVGYIATVGCLGLFALIAVTVVVRFFPNAWRQCGTAAGTVCTRQTATAGRRKHMLRRGSVAGGSVSVKVLYDNPLTAAGSAARNGLKGRAASHASKRRALTIEGGEDGEEGRLSFAAQVAVHGGSGGGMVRGPSAAMLNLRRASYVPAAGSTRQVAVAAALSAADKAGGIGGAGGRTGAGIAAVGISQPVSVRRVGGR
jgi:hypothetical protein